MKNVIDWEDIRDRAKLVENEFSKLKKEIDKKILVLEKVKKIENYESLFDKDKIDDCTVLLAGLSLSMMDSLNDINIVKEKLSNVNHKEDEDNSFTYLECDGKIDKIALELSTMNISLVIVIVPKLKNIKKDVSNG